MIIIPPRPRRSILAPSQVQAANLKQNSLSTSLALSNGSSVASWSDQSGNSNAWTSSSSAQPTYQTNIFGSSGKPGLLFQTDDFMTCDSMASLITGSDMPFSLFLVMRYLSATTAFCPWSAGRSTSGNSFVRYQGTLLSRTDDAATTATISFTGMSTGAEVHVVSFAGTSAEIRRHGRVTSGALDVGTMTLDRFTLGALRRNTVSGFTGMYVAEWAFWNSVLTSDEMTGLTNYGNRAWFA